MVFFSVSDDVDFCRSNWLINFVGGLVIVNQVRYCCFFICGFYFSFRF